jgi:hypothetical protein
MPGGFVYLTLSNDRHLVLALRRTRARKFDAFSDSVGTLFSIPSIRPKTRFYREGIVSEYVM